MKSQIVRRKLLNWIPVVIFFGVLLNFFLFFVTSIFLGGTAELGYIADGKYFLGDHGYYVEVSKMVFIFSEIYTKFTMAIFPLAFIAFPFMFLNKQFRALLQGKK